MPGDDYVYASIRFTLLNVIFRHAMPYTMLLPPPIICHVFARIAALLMLYMPLPRYAAFYSDACRLMLRRHAHAARRAMLRFRRRQVG